MMNKNYYAVIMAGGVGSRFWPVSTPENPKQFHDMLGTGQSLIQQTFNRLARLIPSDQILIATNEKYKDIVLKHLPQITENQILLEPVMRNTAPCILYAGLKIAQQNSDAVMIVAPSDHFIENEEEFVRNVSTAFEACQKDDILMTLGIQPSSPNTGFGYIQFEQGEGVVKKVRNFTEKPDLKTAEKFLAQGDYLWNAGIFIWSAKSVLASFRENLSGMYDLFNEGSDSWNSSKEKDFIAENYSKAENISIDYGIMEKAENVYVMGTDFGWNDLGTWGSLYEKLSKDEKGNANVNARTYFLNAQNNMVRTQEGKQIVVAGLNDYIIVETQDTLMIFPKSEEQNIKQVSKAAEEKFAEE
jgi:mannose-1-phosphate guanylyltransferase